MEVSQLLLVHCRQMIPDRRPTERLHLTIYDFSYLARNLYEYAAEGSSQNTSTAQ